MSACQSPLVASLRITWTFDRLGWLLVQNKGTMQNDHGQGPHYYFARIGTLGESTLSIVLIWRARSFTYAPGVLHLEIRQDPNTQELKNQISEPDHNMWLQQLCAQAPRQKWT